MVSDGGEKRCCVERVGILERKMAQSGNECQGDKRSYNLGGCGQPRRTLLKTLWTPQQVLKRKKVFPKEKD